MKGCETIRYYITLSCRLLLAKQKEITTGGIITVELAILRQIVQDAEGRFANPAKIIEIVKIKGQQ